MHRRSSDLRMSREEEISSYRLSPQAGRHRYVRLVTRRLEG
jgi:hypothetical protein